MKRGPAKSGNEICVQFACATSKRLKVPRGTYMKNTSDCGLVILMSEELVYIPSIL